MGKDIKANKLDKLLKGHTLGWVSLSSNYGKVVASAGTLKELLDKLNKIGNPKGYIMKAAKNYSTYIGV